MIQHFKEPIIHVQSKEGVCECNDIYRNRDKIKGIEVVCYNKVKENEEYFLGGISDIEGEEVGKTYIYIREINKYVPNDCNIEIKSYKEQCMVFMNFIRLLGAKEFNYKIHIKEGKKLSLVNKIKARLKIFKTSNKVEISEDKELESSLNLKSVWIKNEERQLLNENEYQEAITFFNSNPFLKQTTDCKILLDARNPKENNQQKSFVVSFNLAEGLQSSIDVATKISYLKMTNIKNDFCLKTKVNKSVEISFNVEF